MLYSLHPPLLLFVWLEEMDEGEVEERLEPAERSIGLELDLGSMVG